MFERFTIQSRQAVVGAQEHARRLGHHQVGTEHLLLALLEPDAGAAARLLTDAGLTLSAARTALTRALGEPTILTDEDAAALEAIGIDIRAVQARIEDTFGPGALAPGRRSARTPLTPRCKKVLQLSLREAVRLRSRSIGTEHLLLGLIREGQGLAAKIMADAGVDFAALRRATEDSLRRAA